MVVEHDPSQEPSKRVRMLAEAGSKVEVQGNVPIRRYFRSGQEMIKMANVYYDEKDWERAFVLYNKYITIFVEKLPQHPLYKSARTEDLKACRKTLKTAFPKAEETKLKVREKYEVEHAVWKREEQARQEEEARRLEEERLREEEQRLQREKEEAMGEEERMRLRAEREMLALKEQERLLNEQKEAVLKEQQREKEVDRQEAERRRLLEEQRAAGAGGAYDRPPPYLPAMAECETKRGILKDRHSIPMSPMKVDRSNKPTHLMNSTIDSGSPARNKYGIRSVIIPEDTTRVFLKIAEKNTTHNVETCGILAGKLSQHAFSITHIVVPKQEGTPNSCTALGEEDMFDVMDNNDLITLGWIHTHPSQTAFLSSVDLHTHCPYQIMLPEAIAIVCSAKFNETGIFSLTPDYGLPLITNCKKTGFHEHPKHPPIFEQSDHCQISSSFRVKVIDLR